MSELRFSPGSRKPAANPVPRAAARRAAESFVVEGECHISTYSVNSAGYAQIGWRIAERRSAMTTAHRAAWTHFMGPIPGGMTIDHLCKNRRCVRLEHLRMLTNFENARRTFGRDWPLGECINGHPNSELRTYGGKRVCGPCQAQRQRDYRAKRRAS